MAESLIIVIRNAHQNQGDINIETNLKWSVRDLKRHLRDVYPANPEVDRQRLIYAGQLMKDDVLVQDYLKRLPDTNIVHLVCAQDFPHPLAYDEGLKRRKLIGSNPPAAPPATTSPNAVNRGSNDATSFRTAQSAPNFLSHPTVGFPALPINFVNLDANSGASYAQTQHQHPTSGGSLYMNQYFQYLQQIYGVNPTNIYWPMYGGVPYAQMVGQAATINQQPPQANQAEQAVQPPQQVAMNAQGGVVEDAEEGGRNDWLDWVYTFCRASLLLVVLFSYSSMERLTFVMFVFFLFFAYHNGWFAARRQRDDNRAAAGGGGDRLAQDAAAGQRQANDNNNNRIGRENGAPGVAVAANVDHNQAAAQPNAQPEAATTIFEPNASAWHVFWSTCYTFFSSFFASIIPERAPPMNF